MDGDKLKCVVAFEAVKGDSRAIKMLKEWLMNELGSELYKFVEDLDGKSLVQLLASIPSIACLAFMFYNHRANTLYGGISGHPDCPAEDRCKPE